MSSAIDRNQLLEAAVGTPQLEPRSINGGVRIHRNSLSAITNPRHGTPIGEVGFSVLISE